MWSDWRWEHTTGIGFRFLLLITKVEVVRLTFEHLLTFVDKSLFTAVAMRVLFLLQMYPQELHWQGKFCSVFVRVLVSETNAGANHWTGGVRKVWGVAGDVNEHMRQSQRSEYVCLSHRLPELSCYHSGAGEEGRRERRGGGRPPKLWGIRFFRAPCCVAQLGRVHCACNTLDGLLDIPHGVSS